MALSRTNDFSGPYTANGITTEFPFALPVVADSDIAVTLDGVTVSSSLYTISRTGETGTVTFTTAPASGEVLVLLNPDFAQATEFETGASFSAAAINKALDRAASRDAFLKGEASRAIKVPAGETAPTIASLADADGMVLGIASGQLVPLENTTAAVAADVATTALNAGAAEYAKNEAQDAATIAQNAKTDAQAAAADAEDFRDETETIRDAAIAGAEGTFDDIAAAIAGTATGDYFTIPSASSTGYLDLYKNVDDTAPNVLLIDTLPNKTAVDNAISAAGLGQVAVGIPAPRMGLPGTRLDFADSRFGATYVAGTLASSAGAVATSLGTFARATAAYEQTGQGTFTSLSSGTPAYGAKGKSRGLAIRPSATNDFGFSDDISNAAWTKTNTTVASSGTNCLGRTRYSLTDNATSGFHSVRQSEAVNAVAHVTAIIVDVTNSTIGGMQFAHSTPFGSPIIDCNFASLTTTQTSGTAVTSHGAVQLGNGKVLFYMVASASSAATTACTIYMKDGSNISYSGTGKVLLIEHVQLYEGTAVLPPILTTTSSSATRNADTFTIACTGTQKTILLDIDNAENLIPNNATAFDWNDGTANNRVRVFASGGNWTAQATSGGTAGTAVTGPAVGLNDSLALAFDAGTVRWAVNGVAQSAVTGSPSSGLTTLSLGHNAANSAQLNAYLVYAETADGALSNDELEVATGGAAADAATSFDTTKLVVQATSTRIRIFQHNNGGANNDWIGEDLEYRTLAANRSLGWARGKVARYTRIGEFTFTEVEEYIGAGSANDDSWKISGEAAAAFNAIMDQTFTPTTSHGWREAIASGPDAFYADGALITPATAGNFTCGAFRGTQSSILLTPSLANSTQYNTTGKFADGYHEWTWGGGVSEYRNRIAYTATVTVDKNSYLAMYDIEDSVNDFGAVEEGIYGIGDPVDVITSTGRHARRFADNYSVHFEVLFGVVAEMSIQDSNTSSARGKIYYRKLAVDTVRNSGDVDEAIVRHRWSAR